VFLAALLIFVGIPAFAVIKVARIRAARTTSPSPTSLPRLEALERSVQDLQHELERHRSVSISPSVCSARHAKSGDCVAPSYGVTTRFRKYATVPGPIHNATPPFPDGPDLTSFTISTGCG